MREERKKVWVHAFQTKLFLRISLYWMMFLVTLWNFLFIWRLLEEGPGNPLEQYGRFVVDYYRPLLLLVVLVPVASWDAVRFSHRLVGPLWRFSRTMSDLADGQTVRPIKLRDGDFLQEMREDFNGMLDSLQRRGVPVMKSADPAEAKTEQINA